MPLTHTEKTIIAKKAVKVIKKALKAIFNARSRGSAIASHKHGFKTSKHKHPRGFKNRRHGF